MSAFPCSVIRLANTDFLIAFVEFKAWTYLGDGSFSDAFAHDRRFHRFAQTYKKSAVFLRRTPVADLEYLAAIVDYTLFLQNCELRLMYFDYEPTLSASTWEFKSLPTVNLVPLAEMRQSRPYLDSLRKLGLASDWYLKPACLAALRNAQARLPTSSSK